MIGSAGPLPAVPCSRSLAIASLAGLCCACSDVGTILPEPSRGVQVRFKCPPPGESEHFYAAGLLDPRDEQEDRDVRAYASAFLTRMRLESLSCSGEEPREAYRLLRLGSTDMPTAVTVIDDARGARVSWVQLSGPAWAGSPVERTRGSAMLSDLQWTSLTTLVADVRFWGTDTVESSEVWRGAATSWIFEGRRAGSYHVVRRGQPRADRLEELGFQLLRLAAIDTVDPAGVKQ